MSSRRVSSAATLVVAVLVAGLLGARAQTASVPQETIDTLNKVWGVHPGYRANHAKGRVVEGTFTSSPDGSALSIAALFKDKTTPVTVRFSDSSGLPALPDAAKAANPHGLSVKFHQSNGSDVDFVTNSLHFFPVANGDDFLALLQAIAASPPTAPKPTKLDAFFAAHPVAPKALATAHTPSSFAREHYYSVDAFILVDAGGKRHPVRFEFVPKAGTDYLSAADAEKMAPNYLMDEITSRVAHEPVSYDLVAQLANAGDPVDDPTKPWGDDRKRVTLGTLTLDKADPDSAAAERKLLYLPSNLTAGIEMSDDPLIGARVAAYGISFARRSQ